MVLPSPYNISVSDSALARLKQKLELTEFPNELEDAQWTYGAPLADIKRLTSHWTDSFDWRAQEKKMNELPMFQTTITTDGFDPLDIHFVHQKSDVDGAIPLLFVHGWPGSFLEVTRMLPLLKGGDGKPAFHVVAPSLPNFGFSSRVTKKGFATAQYAETMNKIMLALGYDQYVAQGGDWGFAITRAITKLFPTNCKGLLTNWAFASAPKWTTENPEPEYSDREKAALARGADWWAGDGRGYFAQMATKPATIGFALRDSPVALLAWIYEKLRGWTDDYPWTDDEVLTWVSIYWHSTAGPAASSYTYYENLHGTQVTTAGIQSYIDVPLGIVDFPVEIMNAPKSWWSTLGPIVYSKSFDKGGHFAAWERPDGVASGLSEMFGQGGGAHGVVAGKSGY